MTTRMTPKRAANLHPKPHPHYETGITDEAAMEGYDLIHNAELEEERVSQPPSWQAMICSKLSGSAVA